MQKLIDFDHVKILINNYEGADLKLRMCMDGNTYMLKFGQKLEPDEKKPLQASYSSSPISEYLGCHVYEIAGIPVQETLLGTYQGRLAVACRDFIEERGNVPDEELIEFKKLENSYLDSSTAGGRTPTYENLTEILENHTSLEPIRTQAKEHYWKMFAVDALIGNFDRHAGNWGYFMSRAQNRLTDTAPVYDCGSSFYPQLNEKTMEEMLAVPEKIEDRVQLFPTAALRVNGRKVRYHEFLLSEKGRFCRELLRELYPKLDMEKIRDLIDAAPGLSETRRNFYKTLTNIRHEVILKPAYELSLKEEKEKSKEKKIKRRHKIIL